MRVMTREEKIAKIYYVVMEKSKVNEPIECMIWDVLDWIENKYPWTYDSYNESPWTNIYNCLIWRPDKTNPVDEQNDDCVDFIYSLVKDENI